MKKGKFKKKLEDIAVQSETQDNDLKVLKDKVKEEVADLNSINKQIFDQEKQIKMLQLVLDRKNEFKKKIAQQKELNTDLTDHYKKKTS